tara:strand:- start:5622 stop:7778 length:2157 start_codon:yes stop_codon:yes gene_type:complete
MNLFQELTSMFSRNQFVVKPPKGTDYFPLGIHKGNRRGSITKYPEVKLVTLKEVADYIATVNDQRLDEVLIVGNYTGGRDIFVTAGDSVRFTSTSKITMGDDTNDNINDSKFDIFHNGTNAVINNKKGKLALINEEEDAIMPFQLNEGSGVTTYFEADPSGAARLVRYYKDILLKDNVLLNAGDGKDFRFYHTGSHSYLEVGPSAPGNLYIRNRNETGDILFAADTDGMGTTDTYFMIDSSALQTQFFYNVELQDHVRLGLGDTMDMSLYHTGSQAYISNTTGILDIKSTTGNLQLSSGTQIDIGNNSGVLYTLPLADGTAGQSVITDGSGALSFGNAGLANGVVVNDSNANTDFPVVFHDENNNLLDDTGTFTYSPGNSRLKIDALTIDSTKLSGVNIVINSDLLRLGEEGTSKNYLQGSAGGPVIISYDGDNRLSTQPDGIKSIGVVKVANTSNQLQFTIPAAQGTAGQVLKYPSSGSTLEWGSVGNQNLYETIAIQNANGTTNIPATTTTDTFTIKEGAGIILDEDASNQLVAIKQSSESLHTKGSWLPTLNARIGVTQQAGFEVTNYAIQQGRWHRHGNLVTAMFKLRINTDQITLSSNTKGVLYIETFPYDLASGNAFHSVAMQRVEGLLPLSSGSGHGQWMLTSVFGTHFNSDGAIEIRRLNYNNNTIPGITELMLEEDIPTGSSVYSIYLEGVITYETNDATIHSTASVDS